MSNNRNELIAYIKRLGYSEKIAEEVLRQKGDRISKSELLNYVVIAASKNKVLYSSVLFKLLRIRDFVFAYLLFVMLFAYAAMALNRQLYTIFVFCRCLTG